MSQLCVLRMAEPRGWGWGELLRPFEAQNIMSESQTQDTELQDLIYTVGVWFSFDLFVTMSRFFILRVQSM